MATDPKMTDAELAAFREQLMAASRTPAYRKVPRVSPEQSPVCAKTPDPELGHALIPKERYTSADFMKLEWERMWTKVWLLGGRGVDIPEPGDYIATEIGRESVLIVRQKDLSVKAFYNVCLHRGNRLRPEGVSSADSFKCQYHHWEYDLDGSFKRIPDLDTFPQGAPPCNGIRTLPCVEWNSFVWFSLNPEVEPFEAYLLEVLSDFQITVPEIGTIKAEQPPIVVITSNRTREIHDALKRRCLYAWVDYPDAARELDIIRRKAPGAGERLAAQVVGFVQRARRLDLFKAPGVAETIDWAGALTELDKVALDPETVSDTIGVLLKYQDDIARIEQGEGRRILGEVKAELAAAE